MVSFSRVLKVEFKILEKIVAVSCVMWLGTAAEFVFNEWDVAAAVGYVTNMLREALRYLESITAFIPLPREPSQQDIGESEVQSSIEEAAPEQATRPSNKPDGINSTHSSEERERL
jgi:hypothetical protein